MAHAVRLAALLGGCAATPAPVAAATTMLPGPHHTSIAAVIEAMAALIAEVRAAAPGVPVARDAITRAGALLENAGAVLSGQPPDVYANIDRSF